MCSFYDLIFCISFSLVGSIAVICIDLRLRKRTNDERVLTPSQRGNIAGLGCGKCVISAFFRLFKRRNMGADRNAACSPY
jgi:hypothetical protein